MIYGLIAVGHLSDRGDEGRQAAGTYIAVLSSRGIGVVVLVLLVTFLHPSLGANYMPAAIGLVGAGLLGLLGYLTSYRALEYGGAVGRPQLLGVTLIILGLVMIGLS